MFFEETKKRVIPFNESINVESVISDIITKTCHTNNLKFVTKLQEAYDNNLYLELSNKDKMLLEKEIILAQEKLETLKQICIIHESSKPKKVYDKAKWYIDEGQDEKIIVRYFDILFKWLYSKNMLSSEGLEILEIGIDKEISLHSDMLTDRGNKFIQKNYKEISKYILEPDKLPKILNNMS